MAQSSVTQEFYELIVKAYKHFNDELFDSELPDCIISIQRGNRVTGHFFPKRWVENDGTRVHEISMNPEFFASRTMVEIFVTLLREMTGLWQYEFGEQKFNRNYRNSEWVERMAQMGILTKSKSEKGVGFSVELVVAQNGKFMHACEKLIEDGFVLRWIDAEARSEEFSNITITTANSIEFEKQEKEQVQDAKEPGQDIAQNEEDEALSDKGGEIAGDEADLIEEQLPDSEAQGTGDREIVPWEEEEEQITQSESSPPPVSRDEDSEVQEEDKPKRSVEDLGEIDPRARDILTKPLKSSFSEADVTIKQPKEIKKRSKTTYVCLGCNSKVWGRPGLKIQCLECEKEFSENTQDSV